MTELLVVIGIILILMSVLLPVVSKIRYASYTADTENEISQISNACNQYFSTFNAYPGPLSNDYIESTGTTPTMLTAHPLELYTNGVFGSQSSYNITGTENLVLGLMGGLRLDTSKSDTSIAPATPYMLALSPTEVGLGPLNLNTSSPGRTPSFLPNGSTYLLWCERTGGRGNTAPPFQTATYIPVNTANQPLIPTAFADPAGTQSGDSPIPEFVDRFPSPGPIPILYLRARVGAKGVVSDGIVADPTNSGQPALYQYDIRDIAAYTVPNPTNSGAQKSIGLGGGKQHMLQVVGSAPYPGVAPANTTIPSSTYFPTHSPTSTIPQSHRPTRAILTVTAAPGRSTNLS